MVHETIRVVIVDDHPLFIDALNLALRPLAPGPAPATAASLDAALTLLQGKPADLILLDLMLPDAGGVESVARVREIAGRARIVVVSGRDDAVTVNLARAMGADGFISKASPLTAIQDQLRNVLMKRPSFPDAPATPVAAAVSSLTPAQARVLAAAATGKLNKQIAYEMNLAEPTIKAHMSAVFKKLGVNNRTQAILALNGGG